MANIIGCRDHNGHASFDGHLIKPEHDCFSSREKLPEVGDKIFLHRVGKEPCTGIVTEVKEKAYGHMIMTDHGGSAAKELFWHPA